MGSYLTTTEMRKKPELVQGKNARNHVGLLGKKARRFSAKVSLDQATELNHHQMCCGTVCHLVGGFKHFLFPDEKNIAFAAPDTVH